jgi:limonene-1,2-epoxide hydrolase
VRSDAKQDILAAESRHLFSKNAATTSQPRCRNACHVAARPAGTSFACAMQLDVTIKGQGRMNLNELCVYEVKDGKIISEQFTSRFHV